MLPNEDRVLLGEVSGKLDTLLALMRDHIEHDNRRFDALGEKIDAHAEDINKAKGAKAMLLLLAAGVSGFVTVLATAAERFFR